MAVFQNSSTSDIRTAWSRPSCTKCGYAMMFSCIEEVDSEIVECTFECRCGETVTAMGPTALVYG